MKRALSCFVLFIVVVLTTIAPTLAVIIGQSGTSNIAASDTAITFGSTFQHVIIKTSSSAAIVYVDINNNTATSADFQLDPGSGLGLGLGGTNMVGMSGFHYIGASATGTISWIGW